MGRAKDLVMRVIPSTVANPFIRAHHYSGKVVNNSKLHFGVFLDGMISLQKNRPVRELTSWCRRIKELFELFETPLFSQNNLSAE